jgi:hypothetical protein
MRVRLMLSKLTSPLPCELEVTFMTLELKEAALDSRRAGLRSWKRKGPRWLGWCRIGSRQDESASAYHIVVQRGK